MAHLWVPGNCGVRGGWDMGDAWAGNDEADLEEGVVVTRVRGQIVILPKSIAALTGDAAEVLADVQATARKIEKLEQRLRDEVAEARQHGVSWNALGWSTGITGTSAQKRWGERVE